MPLDHTHSRGAHLMLDGYCMLPRQPLVLRRPLFRWRDLDPVAAPIWLALIVQGVLFLGWLAWTLLPLFVTVAEAAVTYARAVLGAVAS